MKRCKLGCTERTAGLCIHEWERRAHGEAALLQREMGQHDRTKQQRDDLLAEVRRLTAVIEAAADLAESEHRQRNEANAEVLQKTLARLRGETEPQDPLPGGYVQKTEEEE